MHQIGVGVLGPVFRTYDPEQDRLFAVKAFHIDITPEQAEAFVESLERLVDVGLSHVGLVAPVATGLEEGVPYLAQEYVAAESLDVAMRHYAAASMTTALPLIEQLAEAIDVAHRAGVCHGGLHLRDVFVTPEGARVSGFGVVPALEEVGLHGPIRRPYTAPELIAGRTWGGEADRFALAAIAYELLTGRRAAGTGSQVTARLDTVEGVADVESLQSVFAAALADSPDGRYPTASRFASDLLAAVGDQADELQTDDTDLAGETTSVAGLGALDLLDSLEVSGSDEDEDEVLLDRDAGDESLDELDESEDDVGDDLAMTLEGEDHELEARDDVAGNAVIRDEAEVADDVGELDEEVDPSTEDVDEDEADEEDEEDEDEEDEQEEDAQADELDEDEEDDEAAEELGRLDDELTEDESEPDELDEVAALEDVLEDEEDVSDEELEESDQLDEVAELEEADELEEVDELDEEVDELEETYDRAEPVVAADATGLLDLPALPDPEELRETRRQPLVAYDPDEADLLDDADHLDPGMPGPVGGMDDPSEGRYDWARRPAALVALLVAGGAAAYFVGLQLGGGGATSAPAESTEVATEAPSRTATGGLVNDVRPDDPGPGRLAGGTPGRRVPQPVPEPVEPFEPAPPEDLEVPRVAEAVPAAEPAPVPEPELAPPVPTAAPRPSPAPDSAPAAVAESGHGWLLVRTEPPGASVMLDGVDRGQTPLSLRDVPFGTYSLEVGHEGFESQTRAVTVSADQNVVAIGVDLIPGADRPAADRPLADRAPADRTPADPAPAVVAGSVEVDSRPAGARVILDGRLVGTTPTVLTDVEAGPHQLRIERDGYQPWVMGIEVPPSDRMRVAASLDHLPR